MSQRISIDVTDALVASYKVKLQEAHTILKDLLVALPPEEARRLFKIGLQRRGLPEDGPACAEANPDIMAGTYKPDEHRKDVRSGRNLGTLEGLLEQELKMVRDTRTLCEADAADWALRVYRNAVEALPEKPGIQAWVKTLGAYFERGPQPPDDEPKAPVK